MKLLRFLVVRADGDVRVVTRQPRLRLDEFAYRVRVTIPDSWAAIVGDIDITMPEPDITPTVTVEQG